jgi:hypothetical protein
MYEQGLLNRPDQGLLNRTDIVWLFGETANESFGRQLSISNQQDMDLAQALNGTGTTDTLLLNLPKRELGIFQQLLQNFQEDEALVEYYLSKYLSGPLADRNVSMFLFNDFTPTPSIYAMMAYDAVMALGIGACEIESDFFTGPEPSRKSNSAAPRGECHSTVLRVRGTRKTSSTRYTT